MSLEEFLQLIQPNLTVIAVLITAAIVFIQLFWKFIKFEERIREQNTVKIKELNLGYRARQIDIKITTLYEKVKKEGYIKAINGIYERYPLYQIRLSNLILCA